MKTKENKSAKAEFFKTVLNDKRKMHEHIRKYGSLDSFTSTNFKFAKPLYGYY